MVPNHRKVNAKFKNDRLCQGKIDPEELAKARNSYNAAPEVYRKESSYLDVGTGQTEAQLGLQKSESKLEITYSVSLRY